VEWLLVALAIEPRDKELYRLALTHRSAAGVSWQGASDWPSTISNERLEFLGDSILGAVVSEMLYKRFPDASEGTLTRRRSAIVRAEQLTSWARELELGEYLYISQSERITSSGRNRMLAGAFEALIGAIFLDQGAAAARRFIQRFLKRDVDQLVAGAAHANPKGQLQEITQDRFRSAPTYHTLHAEGPAHERTFTVEVRFRNRLLGTGTGPSKRSAEENAAIEALARLRTEGDLALTPD
jgi:ribonuclease III